MIAPLLALLGAVPKDDDWHRLEPVRRRRLAVDAVQALFHRCAEAQPLLLVLEDLHWIDPASLQVIDHLVQQLAASPIALLIDYRPDFTHSWAGLSCYRQVGIAPLSTDGARAMLDDLLGADPSVASLKQRLIARAAGNPFFLEESVRALEASGVLCGQSGAWQLASDAGTLVLPETVHAVIAAWIDRLALPAKQLLQLASVIGTEVPAGLLQSLAGLTEVAFDDALHRLQSAEFLLTTRMTPEPVYRFRHALTHEVAYASLLRRQRQMLHVRVLRLLEGDATEPIDRMAYHAMRAEMFAEAAAYCRQAGLLAASRSANREAVTLLSQALAALRHLPETTERLATEVDLHFEIRNALFVLGEPAGIPAHLDVAARLAATIGDPVRQATAGLLQSGWHWQKGEHCQAIAPAEQALALAKASGDVRLLALGLYRCGVNRHALGDYAGAATSLRESIALLEANHAEALFAFGGQPLLFDLSFLAWSLAELGDFAAAEAAGRRGWEAAGRFGNLYSTAVMSFGCGHALVRTGQLDMAQTVLERGLECCRADEVAATYPVIASLLGYVRVARGDAGAGFALLGDALRPEIAGRGPAFAPSRLWLAEACRLVGRLAEAEAAVKAAVQRATERAERGQLAWAERLCGDLAARTDTARAGEHYRRANALAAQLGMRPLLQQTRAGPASTAPASTR